MKTVNLKEGMPPVHQALMQMERELAAARMEGCGLVKLIHGYGSTGEGGEIRIAVQKRLREMSERGEVRGVIFGENWAKSDEQAWKLVGTRKELKLDRDLGQGNRGNTIVELRTGWQDRKPRSAQDHQLPATEDHSGNSELADRLFMHYTVVHEDGSL
jgi:hypothetical protein